MSAVKEYVFYSLIKDQIFILTTSKPKHLENEVYVGILFLGEL